MSNPIQDQIDAAAEDASRRIENLAGSGDYGVGTLGDLGREIVQRWFAKCPDIGDQRMCEHVANAPQVVYGAAWLPGVATCAECFTKVFDFYVATYDRLGQGRPCDACGNMVPMGKLGVVSVGPLLMSVSWCLRCAARDEASTENRD